MSPLPVLFLSHTSEMSGAELSLLSLMTALDSARFAPRAVLPGPGPLLDRLVESGIPAHVLPLSEGSVRRPAGILRNTRLLRGFLRDHGVGLVHANSFHAIKLAAPLRRIHPTPLVGHIRDIVPFTRMTRTAILSCDAVICVSEAAAANLADGGSSRRGRTRRGAGSAPRPERVRVIHNGVDPAAFANLPPRGEALSALGMDGTEGPLIGMAAPLVRWKGQEVFLKAAALVAEAIPGAGFVIAGGESFAEPGYVETLRAAAEAPGLRGRVRFLGFTSRLRDLFAALDVVACPSIEPDPLPRAVLEAMAAGRPVVASAIGGIPEAVTDGVTGLLVPPGDPSALAAAILRLLRDDILRTRAGREAVRAAAERFSLRAHADRVMSLYDEVLSR